MPPPRAPFVCRAVAFLLLLAVALASAWPGAAAQSPPALGSATPAFVPPAYPRPMPMPLFYLRVAGPKGMKVTFYRGPDAITLPIPATVGLRPGYCYRLALSDVPGFPRRVFVPSVEVRGALQLGPGMRGPDFPATLAFTPDDFARVADGAVLKKVIVLERPDRAIPLASLPGTPLEVSVPPSRDPLVEARGHGLPLAVTYLGQRERTPAELLASAVPGTVLLPGQRVLGAPAAAPYLPWQCCPVYDPIAGPIPASAYLRIPDGGDFGLPAGLDRRGRLIGLDPTDAIATYRDSKGVKRLACSNRVAVCVPRFIVLRGEVVPALQIARFVPGAAESIKGQGTLTAPAAPHLEKLAIRPGLAALRLRPSGVVNVYGTAVFGRVRGVEVMAELKAVQEVNGKCLRPEVAVPECLMVIKWTDKCGALVGEVVTFFLRYTNRGGHPISDVVVSDSLAPRFEYVPGSAKTDRAALFTTQPNEAGSQVVRWELRGELPPGESGTVSFQVRVR